MQLIFIIEGEKQLSRNLLLLSSKVSDWTPAFQQASEYLYEIFSNESFASEGAVLEEEWAPLSPAYAKQKEKAYPGKGILVRTGAMKGLFKSDYGPQFLQITNTADYFKYHQSNQPRTKIPRRVMMKLAPEQKEGVIRLFNTYFQSLLAGNSS